MSKIILNQNFLKPETDLSNDKDRVDPFYEEIWQKTKIQVAEVVKNVVWKAWIEPLEFQEYKDYVLYLSANSSLIKIEQKPNIMRLFFLH